MKIKNNQSLNEWINDEDWEEELFPLRKQPAAKNRLTARPQQAQTLPAGAAEDHEDLFDFSYHASRHERQWIEDSLGRFYQQHWIDDVSRLLKGGKEASVYLCQGNPTAPAEQMAAKVYRPRKFRNLKNDWVYRENRANRDSSGNIITDDGLLHAMRKKTSLGMQLLHGAWIEHEYQTLLHLQNAAVDAPAVCARGDNAILIEYFGDGVLPAPTLNEIDLDSAETRRVFERVFHNIERMLELNIIHGDLSAYNILYWDGDIRLIDFPQAISPHKNHNAWPIFSHDVARVCEYFTLQGVPGLNPAQLARDLWRSRRLSTIPALDPQYLDADNPEDRARWQSARDED